MDVDPEQSPRRVRFRLREPADGGAERDEERDDQRRDRQQERGQPAGEEHRPADHAQAELRDVEQERAGLFPHAPSSWSRGSHPSHRGRYQFQSPSSVIVAGRSTPRTSVASISTAAASPTPNCFSITSESVPKIENTNTITTAALVTTPAVVLIPCATASRVVIPLS